MYVYLYNNIPDALSSVSVVFCSELSSDTLMLIAIRFRACFFFLPSFFFGDGDDADADVTYIISKLFLFGGFLVFCVEDNFKHFSIRSLIGMAAPKFIMKYYLINN